MTMMMSMEQLEELVLAGETEELGDILLPVPLRPPQIPHNLTWNRIRAAAMGSRRLTGGAMTRPKMGS
jgi:hypothetical protein